MAKPDLGMKRQCPHCATKFFDMNHNPIVCPKCSTVFVPPVLPTRAPARSAAREDETPVADAEGAELVSLEDAEAGDDKAIAAVADDVEIEDEPADDTFLEEDEEDGGDDVSGLIDGEIENDEEG